MQSISKKVRFRFVSKQLFIMAFAIILAFPCASALANDQSGLAQWLSAPHRTPGNVVRDVYRHPIETLTFFGVKDNSTIVEILPGSRGYYLELLAPYLKARGVYFAANRDDLASGVSDATSPS